MVKGSTAGKRSSGRGCGSGQFAEETVAAGRAAAAGGVSACPAAAAAGGRAGGGGVGVAGAVDVARRFPFRGTYSATCPSALTGGLQAWRG